jgi:coenzyme PQQ precursor peptide PqqA
MRQAQRRGAGSRPPQSSARSAAASQASPLYRRDVLKAVARRWIANYLVFERLARSSAGFDGSRGGTMVWTTPTLIEICIGLEINGYLQAEF